MQLHTLTISQAAPSSITRFAEFLWSEHPEIVEAIGDDNIDVYPAPPTLGGIGDDKLVREVRFRFTVRFYKNTSPGRAAKLTLILQVIRELLVRAGIPVNQEIDDFLGHDEKATHNQ